VNVRLAGMALAALAVMIFVTACLGPGVGIEANCVTLQTCGKTVVPTLRDILGALQAGLRVVGFATRA
jgi:hypothetical protein